jgi:hypothetical protein
VDVTLITRHLLQTADAVTEITRLERDDSYEANMMAEVVRIMYALRRAVKELGIGDEDFWSTVAVRIGPD